MGTIARLLFGLTVIVTPIVAWVTGSALPERVATHFGHGGYANGWMSRDGYVALIVALTSVVPLLVAGVTAFMPGLTLARLAAKRRDYWLAPERRAASVEALRTYGCVMGIVIALFIAGMHALTVQANSRTPPQLDESAALGLVIVLMILGVAFAGALMLRFRRAG